VCCSLVSHVKGYGAAGKGAPDQERVNRALVAAGVAGLTLMVLALTAAAGGADGRGAAVKPSVALQMIATRQLQMLEQTKVSGA